MTTELPPSTLTKQQYKSFGPKPIAGYGPGAAIWAHVRYDDQCGNGHNSFAITGSIRVPINKENLKAYGQGLRADRGEVCGGCCHDEIAKAFPELAPLIKWHLTSSDGPMHYAANVVYHAGDRDHWGCRKGEPHQWELAIHWKNFPIVWRSNHSKFLKWCAEVGSVVVGDSEVLAIQHTATKGDTYRYGDKYTLGGFPCERWHECPFDSELEALEFVAAAKLGFEVKKHPSAWGEGKERDLAAARSCAVWPDATDAELMQEPEALKAALAARLPALMAEFKTAMESLGFTY